MFLFLEHLCEYFAKFGNVESATVKFDKSGRSKGFGFVLFKDRDSTDQVKLRHGTPKSKILGIYFFVN